MWLDSTASSDASAGVAFEVNPPWRKLMRWYTERLVLLWTLCFLAMAVAPEGSGAVVAVSAAAVMIAAAVGSRYVAVALRVRTLTVGERALEHRNGIERKPEPQHPDTAGRPRPRAPGRILLVT
jgi:hypothetical protein